MVIAGSYTPILMIPLGHVTRAQNLLIAEWVGFFFGTIFSAFADLSGVPMTQAIELIAFLSMGCGVVMVWETFSQLDYYLVHLCMLSGATYLVGIIFFMLGDKKHPIYHSVWHLFVVFAAVLHWFGVYLFIVKKDLGEKMVKTYIDPLLHNSTMAHY